MSSYYQVDFGQTASRFNQLQPRSYVHASNAEALVLKTDLPETRLTFLNSASKFIASTKNGDFILSKGEASNALFKVSEHSATPHMTVYGTTTTSNLTFAGTTNKQIVLADYSDTQFAGFGYTGDTLFYQTPSALGRHIFRANAANLNMELVRMQNSAGGAQVGIGLTDPGKVIEPGTTLKVGGTTRILGDLMLSGGLTMANPACNFLKVSDKLPTSALPSNLVYTQANNKIDDSFLTTEYKFQYLKSQKNVGIGTRIPLQKLHIGGSVAVSDRIGIGTALPQSRIHAIESGGAIATMRLENVYGGNIVEAYAGFGISNNSAPVFIVHGDRVAVSIGTSNPDRTKALTVTGDTAITRDLSVGSTVYTCNLVTPYLNIISPDNSSLSLLKVDNLQGTNGTPTSAINVYSPLLARSDFYTDRINGFSSNTVRILGNVIVSKDTELATSPLVCADSNLIDNKAVITNAKNKVLQLSGYICNWKSGATSPGLITEEVAAVLPSAVRTMSDGTKGVVYEALIPLLIQAIKELSAP
jgi:hypothetical protein